MLYRNVESALSNTSVRLSVCSHVHCTDVFFLKLGKDIMDIFVQAFVILHIHMNSGIMQCVYSGLSTILSKLL